MSVRKRHIFLMLLLAGTGAAHADNNPFTAKYSAQKTGELEIADTVALESQKKAILNLKFLIRKQGKSAKQYPTLMIRLVEFQHQYSDILFRLAHSRTNAGIAAKDQAEYEQVIQESITNLTELIENFPKFAELEHAYILRSHAYEAIGKNNLAAKDYLKIIELFAGTEGEYVSYFTLAEYAGNEGKFQDAVNYLNKIKNKTSESNYPYVLYRLAWAHFHLEQTDLAIGYSNQLVDFINASNMQAKNSQASYAALNGLREDMLLEIPLFYLHGLEAKNKSYTLSKALPYFARVAKGSGNLVLGAMSVKMAKLLRAHERRADLLEWKDLVGKSLGAQKESLDVLLIVYEDQFARYEYKRLLESVRQIISSYEKYSKLYSFETARINLASSADRMQSQLSKATPADRPRLSLVLEEIYSSFLKLSSENDPMTYRIHYNLANLLSERKNRQEAIQHYFWIFRRKLFLDKNPQIGLNALQAGIKALSLGYEALKEDGLVPAKISPSLLSEESKNVDPRLVAWMQNLQAVYYISGNKLDNEQIDFFVFESNRILYSMHHEKTAMQRLHRIIFDHYESRYSQVMANLLIDTYVLNKNWKTVQDLAFTFSEIPKFRDDQKYLAQLKQIMADASYKRGEEAYNAGNFREVLRLAERNEAKFANSDRAIDWHNLIANAALKEGQTEKALQYLGKLAEVEKPNSYTKDALLKRATLEESNLKFKEAAYDLKKFTEFFGNTDKDLARTKEKIFQLALVANENEFLRQLFSDKSFCGQSIQKLCDRYQGISSLTGQIGLSKEDLRKISASRMSSAKNAENASIWALVALQNMGEKNFWEGLGYLEVVSEHWKSLDSATKLILAPSLMQAAESVFSNESLDSAHFPAVSLEESAINKRLDLIKHAESSAQKIMGLPWARVKILTLFTLASMYESLGKEIKGLKPPAGISEAEVISYKETIASIADPFSTISNTLLSKSFAIASDSGEEEVYFRPILSAASTANQIAQQAPKHGRTPASEESAPAEDWILEIVSFYASENSASIKTQQMKERWLDSLREKRWLESAFLLRLLREEIHLDENGMNLLTAIALFHMNARAEALDILESKSKNYHGAAKNRINFILLQNYGRTLSRSRVAKILNEMSQGSLEGLKANEKNFISNMKKWVEWKS